MTPVAPALAPSRDRAHLMSPAIGDIVGAGKASTGGGAGSPNGGVDAVPGRGCVLEAALEAVLSWASTSSGMR
ncbi:hypothetical protein G6F60_015809 [Rhizopus arrhizus]|nr:hypothetical protein G6F60_015809 [Rhizopus arrhizus]